MINTRENYKIMAWYRQSSFLPDLFSVEEIGGRSLISSAWLMCQTHLSRIPLLKTNVSWNHTRISYIFYLYSIVVITAMTDRKYKLTIRCSTTQRTIRRRPGGRQLLYSCGFLASLTRLLARQGRNKSLSVVTVLVQRSFLSRSSWLHRTTQPG